jgi:hypothetical protein
MRTPHCRSRWPRVYSACRRRSRFPSSASRAWAWSRARPTRPAPACPRTASAWSGPAPTAPADPAAATCTAPVLADGRYGRPQNLGATVNSRGAAVDVSKPTELLVVGSARTEGRPARRVPDEGAGGARRRRVCGCGLIGAGVFGSAMCRKRLPRIRLSPGAAEMVAEGRRRQNHHRHEPGLRTGGARAPMQVVAAETPTKSGRRAKAQMRVAFLQERLQPRQAKPRKPRHRIGSTPEPARTVRPPRPAQYTSRR